MTPAAEPPAVVAPAPAEKPAELVVSRVTRSDVLVSRDTPLPLVKAGRTEDALLRQAIFVTGVVTVVRPTEGAGDHMLRWTYAPYLQRQLCLTSITGLFSCAAAEVEELAEKAAGETALAAAPDGEPAEPNPAPEAALSDLAARLRARSTAAFDLDRRLKLMPMLKAAGVSIARPPAVRR